MQTRTLAVAVSSLGVAVCCLMAAGALAQDDAAPGPAGLPDLVGALRSSPGCLGIERAETVSGKKVIFAWFEDKKATLRFYHSEAHQQILESFFADIDEGEYHQPLADVPDDVGPIMVVVSPTMSDRPHFEQTNLPVSQIAIDLYTPLGGGLDMGGRFAPASLKVPKVHADDPQPLPGAP